MVATRQFGACFLVLLATLAILLPTTQFLPQLVQEDFGFTATWACRRPAAYASQRPLDHQTRTQPGSRYLRRAGQCGFPPPRISSSVRAASVIVLQHDGRIS